jgi:hypothetical protein
MKTDQDLKQLLIEIRDNQQRALQQQQEHLEIARKQLERSNNQVSESINLQKQAMARFKLISMIAIPGILLCIGLIIYLMTWFF